MVLSCHGQSSKAAVLENYIGWELDFLVGSRARVQSLLVVWHVHTRHNRSSSHSASPTSCVFYSTTILNYFQLFGTWIPDPRVGFKVWWVSKSKMLFYETFFFTKLSKKKQTLKQTYWIIPFPPRYPDYSLNACCIIEVENWNCLLQPQPTFFNTCQFCNSGQTTCVHLRMCALKNEMT